MLGAEGEVTVPIFADLQLNIFPSPPVEIIRCGEITYRVEISNFSGPDHAPDTFVQATLGGVSLLSIDGCDNDPEEGEGCELGTIDFGIVRAITYTGVIDASASSTASFQATVTTSANDISPGNDSATVNTTVLDDTPPVLNIISPVSESVFNPDDLFLIEATVTDVEDDDMILGDSIQWRSSREGLIGMGTGPMSVGLAMAGGHTITATVTDSCENTVTDEVVVGIIPSEPLVQGSLIGMEKFGEQGQPDIASDAEGNYVVVWSEQSTQADDVDGSIQAQRFDGEDGAIGDPFRVNSFTTGLQHRPSVALHTDGSFVVVWQSTINPDGGDSNIVMRRFDSTGTPQGDEDEMVNTFADGDQQYPAVTVDRLGGFVVVWEGMPHEGDSDGAVLARRFDNSGGSISDDFQVNRLTTGPQGRPDVAAVADGGFLVVWQSDDLLGTDQNNIHLLRFDADDEPVGTEIQVNIESEGDQTSPAIDTNLEGRAAIVWKGEVGDAQRRTLRIGGGSVNNLGELSPVNFEAFTTSDVGQLLFPPDIALSQDGDFVVTWAHGPQEGAYRVRTLPFLGLDNAPIRFGDPLGLDPPNFDVQALVLPALTFARSDTETRFFVFWPKVDPASPNNPLGPVEDLDVTGRELILPFPPLLGEWDLEVFASPDPVVQGEFLTYTIRAENLGPAPAKDVFVELRPPTEWSLDSAPSWCDAPGLFCELGTVMAGTSVEIVVTGTVVSGTEGNIGFSAEVVSSTPGGIEESVTTTVLEHPAEVLFADGFESGDTSSWTDSTPLNLKRGQSKDTRHIHHRGRN